MLKAINLSMIILLLAWISFLPEPIQGQYQNPIRILLGITLFIAVSKRRFKIATMFEKGDMFLWLFSVTMLVGVFFAKDIKLAWKQYSHLFITLFLLYYLIKLEFNKETRLPIIKSVCIFGSIVSLFGILELILRKNFIYIYLIPNNFYIRFIGQRAMSTQFHPAVLGTYLIFCIAFCLILIERDALPDKYLGIFSLISISLCLILTFSRGSLFGAATFFWVYFWRKNRFSFSRPLLIFSLAFILLFSILGKANPVFYRFSVMSLIHKETLQSRITRVLTSYEMFKHHPIVGVGLGNFRGNYNKYSPLPRPDDTGMVPDNVYLLFLCEAGIIGFLGFIIFIWYLLNRAFRHFYLIHAKDDIVVVYAVTAGFTGLLVNMNTYDLLYWRMPLFLFSILAGMLTATIKYG